MKQLIHKLAQDGLWSQWVSANSASAPTLDAGCISGAAKATSKAGCISRGVRGPKAGCISRGVRASKAGCIS
jgi:hypothetical protein